MKKNGDNHFTEIENDKSERVLPDKEKLKNEKVFTERDHIKKEQSVIGKENNRHEHGFPGKENGKNDRVIGSKDVVKASIRMALTSDRQEEKELQKALYDQGILTAAVDYGGEFISSVMKIVERAVVSAKREGIIKECHIEEGAVAGAAREALSQVMPKALGLNVGGKIGVARCGEHVSVAMFFGIGLLHLNEVAIGTGHRVV